MLSRPPLRPAIAIRKPSPSAPSRFAAGTRTSSKITWRVGCAFQPIFSSFGAERQARRVPLGTTNAEIPRGPLSPVRAITT